jgi:membrane protein
VGNKPPPALHAIPRAHARAVRLSQSFAQGLVARHAFDAAASIAFWFFLSLVPLLVLVGYVVGTVARERGIDQLVAPLFDVVPAAAVALVRKELERLAGASGPSVAPLGVAGFLWTASSGLHNLMDVFETTARVVRRPWWKQRAIALAWVLLGLATACVIAWLLVNIDAAIYAHDVAARTAARAHGALQRRVHKALHARGEQVLAAALLLAAGMALLAAFYRFAVEHPAGVRRRVWPGTVVAVASWLVVSWVFGEYVASMADYALYYGGLAAVAVLLVWLYLTSLTLVIGAEVNAQLERGGTVRAAR